ncbi:PAS domain S-box protein [Aetokthonos hydrillicola Thurmond2011]|jgi:PAS domain S-box-containing protein|uniref:histidine kinase n=1 Tax=Aetokthonos hydrillicola Thurmond2011 TaxID=2712845 RepID=A0AAP5IGR0_9CYAN|nr:PAS domain S-box protein [Aetokthonos hydrillicola]MBO3458024.1 PAS domain S-box protein [Aetokthonos hydrillicola CCALA 1050]MBW4587142.1 PAS domain S-box protein [Aetokthonos hydrillicola CCALA 1050]MDR9899608.1 PAS domain S-box protein [Aetokthonos hydrillicola Thurmond2011]
MGRRDKKALRSNLEQLLNQIAQHIRQSLNLEEVLNTTVADVREFLLTDRVLIYRVWGDGTGTAITEAVLPEYPSILGETFPPEVFPPEYHQAYAEGKIRAITHITRDNVEPCLVEFLQQFGVRAKLVVPIIQQLRELDARKPTLTESSREEGNQGETSPTPAKPYLWGLLIAHHCRASRRWRPLEMDLMRQLAAQVAIAIQQSELYEQLRKLNAELECRVQQRTEELAKTNEALNHTNQTLLSLIAASPRAIFTLDLQGRVKIWNPAAERMFGWAVEEVIDRPNPVMTDLEGSEYEAIWQNILAGITPASLEVRRYRKDGSPLEIVFSAAPLTDSEEQITGLVAVVADITEQKRQAEQVRLLQSVVVNTNDAIIITEAQPIDPPGPRIIYVNQAFTTMTGYTLEDVLGKTPRIFQGPKTDRAVIAQVRSALSRWQSITVELINYRKDRSEFWAEFSIVPVADKQGRYTHWISVQRDITERKRTEAALRQSEERFRSLIENSLDIITILTPDGTIFYENPSVEQVLGYSPQQLIGQNFFTYIHPDDLGHIQLILSQAFHKSEETSPIEFRRRHQDGQWRTFEALSKALSFTETEGSLFEGNQSPKIVVNSRDITERKRLDEVRLALEREKELRALKTRFFSMVSHEFRTPLSTVLAAAQLLETSPGAWENSQKRERNLRRIQDSVKNMVQLLEDILTINRAETGKLEFNAQWLDLERFCRHFVEEMQLSAGVQHTLNFACHGKNTLVYGDEKLLRSILSNILSNAIKYSPPSGQVQCLLTFEKKGVQIQIRDWGLGIPIEDQKQLFEPFYRGKNIRHIAGTGLGLVVVQKCVELHGGNIEITSDVGRGTTVTIRLPHCRDTSALS